MRPTRRVVIAAATGAAVLLAAASACGSRATGRQPGSANTSPATARRTGWIPPGPALPPDAVPSQAPNIVWLDSLTTIVPQLEVDRVTSLRRPATPIARISPPDGQQFVTVAAADDDRTFVTETVSAARIARFYEIRLDRSGKPGPLVGLRFTLPDPAGRALAITPDGREIATGFSFHKRAGISVISTATGRIRKWAWSGPSPEYLAWSGDHSIDFVRSAGRGLRVLSTSAAGGSLGASRALPSRFLRFGGVSARSVWFIWQLVTTPDGRTAYLTLSSLRSQREETTRYLVVSINAASAAPHAVLTQTPFFAGGNDDVYCGVLWADGSGRHVLVSCERASCLAGNPGCIALRANLAPYIPFPDIPTAWGG